MTAVGSRFVPAVDPLDARVELGKTLTSDSNSVARRIDRDLALQLEAVRLHRRGRRRLGGAEHGSDRNSSTDGRESGKDSLARAHERSIA